jgi:acyl-CoA reductase-like NAD-dependent aldehyde dehydrogenase
MLEDKDLVSIQEVRTKVEKAYAAWQKYRAYNQQQVDAIVERMAAAGRANAERLAALAVEETGYGNVKDKIASAVELGSNGRAQDSGSAVERDWRGYPKT